MAKSATAGNQRAILANQRQILANQRKLDRILANQARILANQPCWKRRFGNTGMSNPVTALTPRLTISPLSA